MFCFSGKAGVQAKLVRRNQTPCLVASYKESTPPVVWQFDLEKMGSHAVTLREKDGEWELGLLLPQGVFTPIAHFDERRQAEEAYAATQKTLLRDASPFKNNWWRRLLMFLGVLFIGFFVMTFFSAPITEEQLALLRAQAQKSASTIPTKAGSLSSAPVVPTPLAPKEIRNGVPMSADDVLEPPAE